MRMCIVGDPQDLSAAYIGWLARRRDIETLELPENALGVEWSYAFDDFRPSQGYIEVAGAHHEFDELSGAFVRLNPQPDVPPGLGLSLQERGALVIERRNAIQYLLNSLPFAVANRPYAGRSNGSKPFQMRLLTKAGFEVPRWVATNEEAVVKRFARTCADGVVYKACSGLRSRVRLLDEQVLCRLREGTSPIVVQEYIRGRDVRVHTVAHRAFATEAISHGVDYRFEGDGNEFRPTSVPRSIENLCFQVAASEGLTLAGFDFRVSEEGCWYCLEVNPVPTFLPYEMATGQPIGDTLLGLLSGAGLP